jgi:chorismate synthase
MLRYLTAGESHGPALVTVADGVPAGLTLVAEDINGELKRRQWGFGRGKRMEIEADTAEILGGVRRGKTLGSPVSLLIRNKDWENWKRIMAIEPGEVTEILTKPRPGHADLAGALKLGERDLRNILERASARETAARVAVGALAKRLLAELEVYLVSHVVRIGQASAETETKPQAKDQEAIDLSPVRCWDRSAAEVMVAEIQKAIEENDSLGGVFEIIVYGLPPGLGDFRQWDKKLDGRIAAALTSIQAIKGVEFGLGFALAELRGSQAQDEIYFGSGRGYYRKTNRAGGFEGGMTNGEPLVMRAIMKPIATLGKPLKTVDMLTKEEALAFKERADVCAVPSAAVVGEAVVAIEVVNAVLAKFGSDSLDELKSSYQRYLERIRT